MSSNTHITTLSSWVLLIAKAIDSYGHDSRELFEQAGMDHARLRDPLARFRAHAVDRLWMLAEEAVADPGFGLTVASFWHPTTLHALGYSWLASDNLAEAFDCALRYARIVDTESEGVLRIESTEDHYKAIIDVDSIDPPPSASAVDAVLAMLLIMCQAAYGSNFRLQRVTIQHEAPAFRKRFEDLFQAPVDFSEAENALWIDPELVKEPLATANPELVRINNRIVTDYLAQLDRSDLGMRVRSKLIEHLPGGHFSETEIASSLNVSQRSLQRKLREQDMSFTQLLENTRRELALQYARDPQHSFNEVAFLLGFTEPANFSRAFKRWHGKSPSQFRQDSLS
jgi:AraC-like DNA-binding protein